MARENNENIELFFCSRFINFREMSQLDIKASFTMRNIQNLFDNHIITSTCKAVSKQPIPKMRHLFKS